MKTDIASVVSLLTQQPRALQKHPRLLVTIRKRILGESPAVGTRGAMQITLTSHAQRPQRQICSLWYSILIMIRMIYHRTDSSCWHTWRHADYSNKPCATTTTANLFFVVFYSYQRESPSSDFSLSCDDKSVAQDIGASVSSQTTWKLLNVAEIHTIG